MYSSLDDKLTASTDPGGGQVHGHHQLYNYIIFVKTASRRNLRRVNAPYEPQALGIAQSFSYSTDGATLYKNDGAVLYKKLES